jgi:tetratricopeptide (TPR) repeat protein
MKLVRDFHHEAMALAEQADAARNRGDYADADQLLKQALEAERQAARLLADDLAAEPTRSVLYRSAATLAFECGELDDAERLISQALAGTPPAEIAQELITLREQVAAVRHRVEALPTPAGATAP